MKDPVYLHGLFVKVINLELISKILESRWRWGVGEGCGVVCLYGEVGWGILVW